MTPDADHKKLFSFLIDPDDPTQTSIFGRLRHLILCSMLILFLLGLIYVGGVISMLFFQLSLSYLIIFLTDMIGTDQQVGPLIWVPASVLLGIVWYFLVAAPVVWAALNILGAKIGICSVLHKPLARSPGVVLMADRLAKWAMWSFFQFRLP
ncbi:hypothetical protein [Actibacterium sp. 188UL27-1]|uniref:hypothetical protein n=1 Tax=Actibacterium sp. 188UL27-1 TaxID=2786961 RepID=UPI00195C95AF|nr:hypothetical protein [Actibacterium sp. 188UL27-1]MBM7066641.1 hypothetical protein [Actibacterium sp. 188UL27-1]